MTNDSIWLSVRLADSEEKRRLRRAAAAAGLTMSDYVRFAVAEKLNRDARRVRDNPHPSVPVGTDGTTAVECGVCGQQEVRTQWEMDHHGKCRARADCPRCLADGLPMPPLSSGRTTSPGGWDDGES